VAVYNVGENLTPVLLTAMHTCFTFHLLVFVLVSRELILALLVLVLKELTLALVLLQLVLTTTLHACRVFVVIL